MAAVAHLKIADLYHTLQKSTNEETALAVIHAFEQIQEEQELSSIQIKKEILKEISFKDLATKQDIKALESVTKQDIKALESVTKQAIKTLELTTKKDLELGLEKTKTSLIKWMIGLVFVPIIFALVSKHFGI